MSQAVGSNAIKFECGICQKEFSTSWCLQIHIQTHNEKKRVVCQECGESFPDVNLLCEHLKDHILGENVETCMVCGKEYPSSEIEAHKRSHIFKPGLTCKVCGKSFGSRQVLVLHLRSHGAKDPFKCQMCGVQFASRNSFSQHWNSHLSQKISGENGFKSRQKKGKQSSNLPILSIFSKNGKRLTCVICSQSITSKIKAEQHAKTHLIKKRQTFVSRKPCPSVDNLERKRHAGERARKTLNPKHAVQLKIKTSVSDVQPRHLSCSECDQHFRDNDELQTHKNIHIEELSARLLRLSSPSGKICQPLEPNLVLDAVQSVAGKKLKKLKKQRMSQSLHESDKTESLVPGQQEDICMESFVSLPDVFLSPARQDDKSSKTNMPNHYKLTNVRVVLERLDMNKINQLRTGNSSKRFDDRDVDTDVRDSISLLSTAQDASEPRNTSLNNEGDSMQVKFDDDVIDDIGDISSAVKAALAACDDILEKTSSQNSVAAGDGGSGVTSTNFYATEEPKLDPLDVGEDVDSRNCCLQDDPGISDDDVERNEDIEIESEIHIKKYEVLSENRFEAKNHNLAHFPEPKEIEPESIIGVQERKDIQTSINESPDLEFKPRERPNEKQSASIKENYRKVKNKYVCSICEKSYASSKTIYRHVYEHLQKSKRQLNCKFCGHCLERRSHLIAHESLHIKHHATIGGVREEDVQKIKENMLKDGTGISCKMCSLTFKLRIEAYRHVFSHFFQGTNKIDKSSTEHQSEKEPKETKKKILLHEALNSFVAKDGSYTCSKCDKVLHSTKTAYVHYKRHVMSPPFSCSVCSHAAFTRHHLDRHMKTHLYKRNLKFISNTDMIDYIDNNSAEDAAMAACDILEKTSLQDSVTATYGGSGVAPTNVWGTKEPKLYPLDDVEEDVDSSDCCLQDDPEISDDNERNGDIEIDTENCSDENHVFKSKVCEFSSENKLEAKNHNLSHFPEPKQTVSDVQERKDIQTSINESPDLEFKPRERPNEKQSASIKENYRKVKNEYVCSICEKSYVSSKTIYRHVYEHLQKSKRQLNCKFCGHCLERRSHLIAHESLHINHHATIGGVREEDVQKIKENMLKDGTGISCKMCSLTFKLRIDAYRHVFSHFFQGTNKIDKSSTEHQSEKEPKETKKKILLHEALNSFVAKDGSYTCSKCDKVLHSKKTAYVHYKHHVMSPPFSCSVCSYAAFTRHHLDRHMNTHLYKRNLDFICAEDKNAKQFTSKEAVAFIEMEANSFKCKLCGSILKTRDIAIAHVVRHNQKGRFRCKVCDYSIHSRHHLEKHARRHIQYRQHTNTLEEVVPVTDDQLPNLSHIDLQDKDFEEKDSSSKISNSRFSFSRTGNTEDIKLKSKSQKLSNNPDSISEGSEEKCGPFLTDHSLDSECSTAPENPTTANQTASENQVVHSKNMLCSGKEKEIDFEKSSSIPENITQCVTDTTGKGSPKSTPCLGLGERDCEHLSVHPDNNDSGHGFLTRRRSRRMSSKPKISYKESHDTLNDGDDSDLDSDFHYEESDHSSMEDEAEDEKGCSGKEVQDQPAGAPSSIPHSTDESQQERNISTTEEELPNDASQSRGTFQFDSSRRADHVIKKGDEYQCSICMETFALKRKCMLHISYHLMKQFSCPKCVFKTTSRAYMLKHLKKHKGTFKENFSCRICKTNFRSFYDLSSHMDVHTDEEKMEVLNHLKCATCGELCKTTIMLFNHQLGHLEKFQCEECKSEFKSAQGLENHLLEEGHYKCEKCDKVFSSFFILEDHLKRIHNFSFLKKNHAIKKKKLQLESRYICVKCYQGFQTRKDLYLHEMRQHGTEQEGNICDICYENFAKPDLLARHKLVHASLATIGEDRTTGITGSLKLSQMLPCTICSKKYPTVGKLKEHLRIHSEKQFVCDVCGLAFLNHSYLIIHEKLHKNIKPFHCKQCPLKFPVLCLLKTHIKKRHSEKKEKTYAKCDVCGKLLCKTSLLSHKKTHLKRSRNFPCAQCGRMFYSKPQMKAHERTHEERSFVCDECGQSLKSKYLLKYHKQSHTGEKPFICEECGRGFRLKDFLIRHMLIHTKVKNHVCEFCDKRFSLPETLKNHRNIHTGEKPYKCKVCGKAFSDRWARFKHEKQHVAEDS